MKSAIGTYYRALVTASLFLVGATCSTSSLADIFPSTTPKRTIYFVVHDENDTFTQSEWDNRVASIQSHEAALREFYATNSGGTIDIPYDMDIIDAGIMLNSDGTRPSGWEADATDGVNTSGTYALIFDLLDTTAEGGWAGLEGNAKVYLQSSAQWVLNHEVGHRVGVDHARSLNPSNSSSYDLYTWNETTQQYDDYVLGSSPFDPIPFGTPISEYGNPFDTMGNISAGDHRVGTKLAKGWLTAAQVPDLNNLGDGTYRIYAHDELVATTKPAGPSDPFDEIYGVEEGYNPNVLYGLTYSRDGHAFNKGNSTWNDVTQQIDIEYRSGRNGIAFYLDGRLVDMDPSGSTSARLLKSGESIEDVDFGLSSFIVNNTSDDFLAFNPPPPLEVSYATQEWFHFDVLSTGSDSVGSYIDVGVSVVGGLNGIDGDLDQSGAVTSTDLTLFRTGWLQNTSELSFLNKYKSGDMNFDGINDLLDVYLFRDAWISAGLGSISIESIIGVPEPSTITLLLAAAIFSLPLSRRPAGRHGSERGKGAA